MIKKLSVENITAENFEDYGTLVTTSGKQVNNDLDSEIFNLYSHLARNNFEGEIIFNILEVLDRDNKFSSLERHTGTEELFFALDQDVIVLVARPDNNSETPDPDTVKAFHMQAGEGMLMKKGTWHWIPYPVSGNKANMLVVFKEGTLAQDLVVVDLEEKENITFKIEKR
ncbi:MAG: ureidoglycolate lyase [Halanaerobiales bacterium]|nr:ureidoglycolate lyase [Halanaerobiales bacterium]